MKIAIAADHAGFSLKERLRDRLLAEGHEVVDLGTRNEDSTDYPDYAAGVARRVMAGDSERGILVCSSGVGMAIAANKINGIRAALAANPDEVRLTRAHNDANILTIGAKFTPENDAAEMIDIFLDTAFDGGRHSRRIAKIAELERTQIEEVQLSKR